ncbi:MAG: ribonuclease HI [Betaproteobacteria bacterium]
MEQIEIYTDGACKGNPGPGGWGALLRSGEHEKEIFGGERHTTNNRMEITAVIESLKLVKKKAKVCIYTDSTYVKDGISSWIKQWKINGWKTAAKKPVKNEELWRELDLLVSQHQIEWVWVKGHAGDEGNERADALANKGVATVS